MKARRIFHHRHPVVRDAVSPYGYIVVPDNSKTHGRPFAPLDFLFHKDALIRIAATFQSNLWSLRPLHPGTRIFSRNRSVLSQGNRLFCHTFLGPVSHIAHCKNLVIPCKLLPVVWRLRQRLTRVFKRRSHQTAVFRRKDLMYAVLIEPVIHKTGMIDKEFLPVVIHQNRIMSLGRVSVTHKVPFVIAHQPVPYRSIDVIFIIRNEIISPLFILGRHIPLRKSGVISRHVLVRPRYAGRGKYPHIVSAICIQSSVRNKQIELPIYFLNVGRLTGSKAPASDLKPHIGIGLIAL